MARSWADLPQELLRQCSRRLCPKNLSVFRAVCRSWRSAAVKEWSDVPSLMLADKGEMLWREFFCLRCEQFHTKLLPEVMANRYFSSRDWVLTISRDWEFQMLRNPMLRYSRIIKLPSWNKFPDIYVLPPFYVSFITKFVLSDSPTTSQDYKVMVIYDHGRRLGLWKPGDEEWTAVTSPAVEYCDVIYHKGCFIALDGEGGIYRCDVDGSTPFEAQVVFEMPERLLEPFGLVQLYLVQAMTGSLLFVSQWEDCSDFSMSRRRPTGSYRFDVFEIDLDTQTYTEVLSLENKSLFLGHNSSFCLEVDENHIIESNCIYFTKYNIPPSQFTEDGGVTNMGIYHLKDGTIKPHVKGKSSPLLWIEPSF
ncbi:putative F-box protein At5g55150 [Rhodamnia argentea]|uniref:F-box protein At5g55150 n=1 Tax=Rhodamnia argentea TaxID=178133 RepID=A0ABM3HK83_9MYRT|nr:putative F-box protein At5g55150 [Rhodamnia argentea]XP_048137009.1 putative F-box protein At5g55150 [Rhodamnia argentea]